MEFKCMLQIRSAPQGLCGSSGETGSRRRHDPDMQRDGTSNRQI